MHERVLGRELTRGPLRRLDLKRMARESKQLIDELDVRLPSVNARVRDLSGGQRQGVVIGRAAHWARLLVLDRQSLPRPGLPHLRPTGDEVVSMITGLR
jgi:ABC-type sugar transport system ATPase subunit